MHRRRIEEMKACYTPERDVVWSRSRNAKFHFQAPL
jgi:hypothetical protein